jgi:hypothetical protein
MSKPPHTSTAVFAREAGRFWTSCSQKVLKYSVKVRGVRCAGYFGVWNRFKSTVHRPAKTPDDCCCAIKRPEGSNPSLTVPS